MTAVSNTSKLSHPSAFGGEKWHLYIYQSKLGLKGHSKVSDTISTPGGLLISTRIREDAGKEGILHPFTFSALPIKMCFYAIVHQLSKRVSNQ